MYKIVNGLVPDYISHHLPLHVGEISRYELRNASNYSSFYTRTETFRRSCLPSIVSLWNELSPELKQCESFPSFQYKLKLTMFGSRRIPEYFLKGNRFLSIMHARLRNNCSNLNNDLFRNHLRESPSCGCGHAVEDAKHYLLECPNYTAKRIEMFRKTRHLHPLGIESILNGKDSCSNDDNFCLFQAVQQYIKDSGRFA